MSLAIFSFIPSTVINSLVSADLIFFMLLNFVKRSFFIISNKKYLIGLFISGLLIFMNWAVWIYAVATDRIIDASFGYFIMPILSVFLGAIFSWYSTSILNQRLKI